MKTIETKVYKFDELSDTAKEKARDWWRGCIDSSDYDVVIDDAVTMGEMLGIQFDTRAVKLRGGTRQDPCVYWSGFGSQGDGACFEGRYEYKPGALAAVRKEAPAVYKDQDGTVHPNKGNGELHRIAKALQDAQKPYFYKLWARVKCTEIDVAHADDDYRDVDGEGIEQALKDFCDWIYDRLQAQNEYLYSDENVDEAIEANEYEFTEEGRIV